MNHRGNFCMIDFFLAITHSSYKYLLNTWFLPVTLPNAEYTAMNSAPCPHWAYILLKGDRQDVASQMVIRTEKKKKTRKRLELGEGGILNMDVQWKILIRRYFEGMNHYRHLEKNILREQKVQRSWKGISLTLLAQHQAVWVKERMA